MKFSFTSDKGKTRNIRLPTKFGLRLILKFIKVNSKQKKALKHLINDSFKIIKDYKTQNDSWALVEISEPDARIIITL